MHKYTALPPTFPNNCKTSCITLCTQHTATQGKRPKSLRRGGKSAEVEGSRVRDARKLAEMCASQTRKGTK